MKITPFNAEDYMSEESSTDIYINISGKSLAEVACKVAALHHELNGERAAPTGPGVEPEVPAKPKATRGRPKKGAPAVYEVGSGEPVATEQPADIFAQQLTPPVTDPFGLNTTGTNGASENSAQGSPASVSPEDLKKKLAEVDRLLGTEKALQLLKDAGCSKLSDLNKATSETQQKFITACDAAVAFSA